MQLEGRNNEENADSVVYFSIIIVVYFSITIYSKSRKKVIAWENFIKSQNNTISIEHILPQTPSDPYWQRRFGKMTEKELKYYQGSLGNLMLLDQGINSSLQNDSFPKKKNVKTEKDRIVRHGYSNGSYSEVEVSQEKNWDKNAIIRRGIKMLEFMEERWDLKFESKGHMEEVLFLDKKNLKHANK